MEHLKLEERRLTQTRIVFEIVGTTGPVLERWFRQLVESRTDLPAFKPELKGPTLSIDCVTLPGVSDAFDKLIGEAQRAVQREEDMTRESREIEAEATKSMLERFKQSQGLGG